MKAKSQKKEELKKLKAKLPKSKITIFTTFSRAGEKVQFNLSGATGVQLTTELPTYCPKIPVGQVACSIVGIP